MKNKILNMIEVQRPLHYTFFQMDGDFDIHNCKIFEIYGISQLIICHNL